ncbi:hypothetical protein KVV02_002800 [Mortierella alpina]|uniref:Secreted protein n=1 Tax=Mortierella alpina TaxID=64518 RepID=A0A9P8ABQ1_MORAP|nr:hypothetical protein KVV02_002800 [Mortierella alpina]
MRLSKTLLISAALAAFMAVAVAQDAIQTEPTDDTPAVVPTTSDNESAPIFFSDDQDDTEDADDTGDAVDADGAGEDADASEDADAGDDADADADDGEQEASSLMKRAPRRAVPATRVVSGKTIAIDNEKDFCLFLPPMVGGDIAKNEHSAIAFCTKPHGGATPGARPFPKGFIQSHHLKVNRGVDAYVQITGRIDRKKYKLHKSDQGGQYDIKATKDSKCAGYNHFVQLIEPNDDIYCLRCCMQKKDCPTYKSEKGCREIISNGNYH